MTGNEIECTRQQGVRRRLVDEAVKEVGGVLAEAHRELAALACAPTDFASRQLASTLLQRFDRASLGIEVVAQLSSPHATDPSATVFCLRDLLARLERMCRWLLTPLAVHYRLPGMRVIVGGPSSEIQQAVLDVILAARESARAAERVTLELDVQRADASEGATGYCAHVSIACDGIELGRAAASELFAPGQSTAPNLWHARHTLRALGGDLRIVREATPSTRFCILLPVLFPRPT